jgi:hypothetical protein
MTQASKFPAAVAAIADFFGEHPSQPANELILNTTINSTDLSIVATTNIPASWPASGRLIIDGEVIEYASYAAATFTISAVGKRGLETAFGAGAAAGHTAGAVIGNWVTAQAVAQIIAEIVALETQALGGIHNPNLVLNSDFSRRTVFGLAMPEVFADLSAWTANPGTIGTVAANVLTSGGTGTQRVDWNGPNSMWRDGRWSATFKLVSTAAGARYAVEKFVDTSNLVRAYVSGDGSALVIQKLIAGTPTTVTTSAQAMTINRWYWIELEAQGTTYIVKVYDTGGTVPGVTKASSTLLQTITGTIADAAVVSGRIALYTEGSGTAVQWGGIATGNGGVYVETWLPESWTVNFDNAGGQAIGYDEAADSGPLAKQWVPRVYIPTAAANMRRIVLSHNTPDGSGIPSIGYTGSGYIKTSGATVSGMTNIYFYDEASNGTLGTAHTVADAGETSWTRKTVAFTGASTVRRFGVYIYIGDQVANHGGTFWVDLPQLEQGSAATAWRNAPADDAPRTTQVLTTSADKTTTSAAFVDIDPRDCAVNIFSPSDETLEIKLVGQWNNSAAGNINSIALLLDGVLVPVGAVATTQTSAPVASYEAPVYATAVVRVAAGKHRISGQWKVSAGTGTFRAAGVYIQLIVTATRGK